MIRTRFAPSPTGVLHIGGMRTALFCWLYAKHYQGNFVLRIEDTDRERSRQESTQSILDSLAWLGLDYDEGPFFQSQRLTRHHEVAEQLLKAGKAYYCYCTAEALEKVRAKQMRNKQKPRYDGCCRAGKEPVAGINPVLRFKNPLTGSVTIHDLVHGEVVFNNHELDDLILLRSDGTPTYNLSVVVDDMDMKITHILRGEDHLNNTPRQINILQVLGAEIPKYAHLPMILDTDGKKLSKRTGAADVRDYQQAGYLPQALLNYIARLGWSHQSQEIFSVAEMIELFDGSNIGASAAALNLDKLDWLNQSYLQRSNIEITLPLFIQHLEKQGYHGKTKEALSHIFLVLSKRYKTLEAMAIGAEFLFNNPKDYDTKLAAKYLKRVSKPVLERVKHDLEKVENWEEAVIKKIINTVCQELDIPMKSVGAPLRFALTNGAPSPELSETVILIGKENCLQRLSNALALIEN